MIGANVLTLEEAYRAIDWNTIILLFGMMIVVANLRLSGFFALVAERAVERAHHPVTLLVLVVVVAGVFSALFVNDTMCIVLTPLILEITSALRRNPVPYLLAVAMASNAGSVATITGNPQNMMIATFSGLSYPQFSAALAPIAVMALAATIAVLWSLYPAEFRAYTPLEIPRRTIRVNRGLLWKSLAVSAGMVAFFLAGWPVQKVALVAGAVLLLTRRVKPEKVYAHLDWPLLALFAGLFVVVAGFEKSQVEDELRSLANNARLENIWTLTGYSAVLSNIVSNVPAVLIFKPFMTHLPDPRRAWLVLAMASTLAGNLTVVGSVANLIVVQRAHATVRIGFREYARAGVPLTLITLVMGALMLGAR